MKYLLNFYKNKIALTITFLSLLSLIPFGFFFNYAKELNELQNINDLVPGHATKVLTRSIALPELYLPFIFGVLFWVANATLSAIGLIRSQIRTLYALATLVIGGLGLHLVIAVMYSVPWNKFIPKFKWMNVLKISTTATLGSTVAIVPFLIAVSAKSFEDPVIAPPVKFSLDKDHPNLVEIFSDGFDINHFDSSIYTNDSNFKDFTWFKRFATAGHPTHLSISMIFNEFKDSNPFNVMYENNLKPREYQPYEYSKGALENGVKHLGFSKNEFNARTIVNPIDFSSSTEYGQSLSGMPESIWDVDPTINITNWSGARDANTSFFGVKNSPPDVQSYKWLANNSKAASQGEKGARVYITDMLTHRPFLVNDKQEFTVWDIKRDDVIKSLHQSISDVISSLKNIKDSSGFSAYDNSMIMVFGDHASHDFMDFQVGDNSTRSCESSFIIKYPKQSSKPQTTMNVVENKFVWSPQINHIIRDYFDAPITARNNDNYFSDYYNNPSSNKFDNVNRPAFNSADAYGWANWKQDSNGEWKYNIDKTLSTYEVQFAQDRTTQKQQVEELGKVVY